METIIVFTETIFVTILFMFFFEDYINTSGIYCIKNVVSNKIYIKKE